jgi:hypothetical protein
MNKRLTAGPAAMVCLAVLLFVGCDGGSGTGDSGKRWSTTQHGQVLEIGFGQDGDFPQYAALHLDSGYLRMVYSRDVQWGSSVILLPSFWSGGQYYQGAPISASAVQEGSDLVVTIHSVLGGLDVSGTIRFVPPGASGLKARVSMQTTGHLLVDSRPGEAFKPVMLASMHISDTLWDASAAFVGENTICPIPVFGWILQPPVLANRFGLLGGTSQWKTNAPTLEVRFDGDLQVTGWVTPTSDPNQDNVGYWGASDTALSSWNYEVIARPDFVWPLPFLGSRRQ